MDGSRLRAKTSDALDDINRAELDAVLDGLDLYYSYYQALGFTPELKHKLKLYIDNKAVHAWLTNAMGNLNVDPVSVVSDIIRARRLRDIKLRVKEMGIALIPIWVPSDKNKADALTRVPEFLTDLDRRHPLTKDQSKVMKKGTNPYSDQQTLLPSSFMTLAVSPESPESRDTVLRQGTTFERDESGRAIIPTRKELESLLSAIHSHEGQEAFGRLVSQLVSPKSLTVDNAKGDGEVSLGEVVRKFVANCRACCYGKDRSHIPPGKGKKPETQTEKIEAETEEELLEQEIPKGTHPFEVIHMDQVMEISGSGKNTLQLITLVDSFSRFAIVKLVRGSVTSTDTAQVLEDVVNKFQTIPTGVLTDNGTEFKGEFARVCTQLGISRALSAPYNQWMNGRVERFHGTLKAKIRATLLDIEQHGGSIKIDSVIQRCVSCYNATWHSAINQSPHSVIFNYPAWIYPNAKAIRPIKSSSPSREIRKEVATETTSSSNPKPGEIWCLKFRKSQRTALGPIGEDCEILRTRKYTCDVQMSDGKVARVSKKDLKRSATQSRLEQASQTPKETEVPGGSSESSPRSPTSVESQAVEPPRKRRKKFLEAQNFLKKIP